MRGVASGFFLLKMRVPIFKRTLHRQHRVQAPARPAPVKLESFGQTAPPSRKAAASPPASDEDDGEEEEDEEDVEYDPCPNCGREFKCVTARGAWTAGCHASSFCQCFDSLLAVTGDSDWHSVSCVKLVWKRFHSLTLIHPPPHNHPPPPFFHRDGEFWIFCDFCQRWFDGKCVGMTAERAKVQKKWQCPFCATEER